MKAYVVSTRDLAHNLQILQRKAGDTLIWGVVKGNGYGLGAAPLAQFLKAHGVTHFAVTEYTEARELRQSGRTEPILLLRGSADPEEIRRLLELDVIFSVGGMEDARLLAEAAREKGVQAKAHVKVDTGMGRYGFLPDEIQTVAQLYRAFPEITWQGIYTHFHTAGSRRSTMEQYALFRRVVDALRESGIDVGMVHCCNSIAFWKYPELHLDAVRLGSCLLGRVYYAREAGLRRVGYVQASVEELRRLPKGHNVGYGGDCKLRRETTTAVVGIGYYHGFSVERGYDVFRPRDCLHNMARYLKYLLQRRRLTVEIGGRPCPVLGHVGMLNLVADVTDVPCQLHDPVIIAVNPLDQKGLEVLFQPEEQEGNT